MSTEKIETEQDPKEECPPNFILYLMVIAGIAILILAAIGAHTVLKSSSTNDVPPRTVEDRLDRLEERSSEIEAAVENTLGHLRKERCEKELKGTYTGEGAAAEKTGVGSYSFHMILESCEINGEFYYPVPRTLTFKGAAKEGEEI